MMKIDFNGAFCFKKSLAVLFVAAFVLFQNAYSQDAVLQVVPDRANAVYDIGENVDFSITLERNGNKIKNVTVNYEIGPEKIAATIKGEKCIEQDFLKISGGSMNQAGFL